MWIIHNNKLPTPLLQMKAERRIDKSHNLALTELVFKENGHVSNCTMEILQ